MKNKYYFDREKFIEAYVDTGLMPLNHYNEVERHSKQIPLKLNTEFYVNLCESGGLKVFTVRDDNAYLVGYAMFIVGLARHSEDVLNAYQDAFYLKPEIRGQGLGEMFIGYCEDELKNDGVDTVFHMIKVAHNWGKVLERNGYELDEYIYTKRLK